MVNKEILLQQLRRAEADEKNGIPGAAQRLEQARNNLRSANSAPQVNSPSRPGRPTPAPVRQVGAAPVAPKGKPAAAPLRAPTAFRPSERQQVQGKPVEPRNFGRAPGTGLSQAEVDTEVQRLLRPKAVTEQQWLDEQLRNYRGGRVPKSVEMGFPYAGATEGMYQRLMELSGRPASKLYDIAHDEHPAPKFGADWRKTTTDLEVDIDTSPTLVDIQNTYDNLNEGGKKTMNLSLFKEGRGNPKAYRIWQDASNSDSVQTIMKEIQDSDTFYRGKFGMTNSGLWMPLKQEGSTDQVFTKPEFFEQDAIVGGRFDINKGEPNLIRREVERRGGNSKSIAQHGYYNPTLPDEMYAINLDKARNEVMGMTKGDLKKLQPNKHYQPINTFGDGKVDLTLPTDVMKDIGDNQATIDGLYSGKVKSAVNKAAGKDIFKAEFLPGADEAIDGLKKNWKGGVAATAMSGASREAAKKAAQGDWGGAIHEAAMSYGTGAVIESGVKRAAATGVGKRLAGAVGKRLAAAGARFGAGTAGSGGLLAPALAAWAVADVADGAIEGFTGKNISQWSEDPAKISTKNRRANRHGKRK